MRSVVFLLPYTSGISHSSSCIPHTGLFISVPSPYITVPSIPSLVFYPLPTLTHLRGHCCYSSSFFLSFHWFFQPCVVTKCKKLWSKWCREGIRYTKEKQRMFTYARQSPFQDFKVLIWENCIWSTDYWLHQLCVPTERTSGRAILYYVSSLYNKSNTTICIYFLPSFTKFDDHYLNTLPWS